MKQVFELNVENADCTELIVKDRDNTHIVTTATIHDEERDTYHTAVMVYNPQSGQCYATHASQNSEDSYFHKVLAPSYRLCCRKLGLTPRVRE